MLETAEKFMEELNSRDWKIRVADETEDGKSHLLLGVTGEKAQVEIHFFFDQDGRSVSIRVFKLFVAPIDKRLEVMDAMNEANLDFRWVKFFLDKDNWMNVQADAVIDSENSGRVCFELMMRTVNIIDDVYPKFMRVIWA